MFDDSTLPDHLEVHDRADGEIVRCRDCGVTGTRPIGHTAECEHEREWRVKQRSLSGGRADLKGQATLAGDVHDGGVDR